MEKIVKEATNWIVMLALVGGWIGLLDLLELPHGSLRVTLSVLGGLSFAHFMRSLKK
jgi:hypothetical protein